MKTLEEINAHNAVIQTKRIELLKELEELTTNVIAPWYYCRKDGFACEFCSAENGHENFEPIPQTDEK